MKIKKLLIVRGDGEVRVGSTARNRRLRIDEIAVPLEIDLPDAWGAIDASQTIKVDLPNPPTVSQK